MRPRANRQRTWLIPVIVVAIGFIVLGSILGYSAYSKAQERRVMLEKHQQQMDYWQEKIRQGDAELKMKEDSLKANETASK